MFAVKEIFYTLQGEGHHTGRAAVFCRFAGCNLWTGLEKDRAEAICDFCDTDFVGVDGAGGGRFASVSALADAIEAVRRQGSGISGQESGAGVLTPDACPLTPGKFVVCTGGEPLLQMTEEFIQSLHQRGFEVAIETNGTKRPPPGIDWICVSPKANAEFKLKRGNELKLIYPQAGAEPEKYAGLLFDHFFLQPLDNADREVNTRAATDYCLAHPQWRLSLQTHKLIGIR
jgi:7-carboxy-7-deazaguanine synthase